MKKKVFFSVVVALLTMMSAGQVHAQMDNMPMLDLPSDPSEKGLTLTRPEYMAMLYHRLSGNPLDYKKWVMEMDTYKTATSFEKAAVLEQQEVILKARFGSISLSEPVTVEMTVRLPEYSFNYKGFTIDAFNPDSYFSYNYNGEDYALVVPKFRDFQWTEVPPEQAMLIDKAADKDRNIRVILTIKPIYADKNALVEMNGKKFRLLAGTIETIGFYAPGSNKEVWQRSVKAAAIAEDPIRNDLLNLYQR